MSRLLLRKITIEKGDHITENMQGLYRSISSYIRLSESLKEEIDQRVKPLIFKKGEEVHSAHRVCTTSYFIEQGILRLYFIKDGREVSEFFCSENEWINSPRSFMQQ